MSLLKRRLLYQKVKSKGQIMTKKREVSPNLAQNHPRRGIFRQHSVLSDKLLEPFLATTQHPAHRRAGTQASPTTRQ
jgi:hypothetical protein